jgi:hypothetical protein
MENFKVVILGAGQVGEPLLSLIKEGVYPFEVISVGVLDLNKKRSLEYNYTSVADALKEDADMYVDCLPYSVEVADSLLDKFSKGKIVITCSKELVMNRYKDFGHLKSSSESGFAYFNSIPASDSPTEYKFVNITHKNIEKQNIENLCSFRGADGVLTSKYVYQDMTRAHHKARPAYEENKRKEAAMKKESLKEKLYQVAKATNMEVEAQPCGIDPVLSEKTEGPNVL